MKDLRERTTEIAIFLIPGIGVSVSVWLLYQEVIKPWPTEPAFLGWLALVASLINMGVGIWAASALSGAFFGRR